MTDTTVNLPVAVLEDELEAAITRYKLASRDRSLSSYERSKALIAAAEVARQLLRITNDCSRVRPHAYVYFAWKSHDGPVKIGYSSRVPERLQELSREYGPLLLSGVLRGGLEREQEIHRQFADCRLEGEWFKPSPTLCAFIRENTGTLPGTVGT